MYTSLASQAQSKFLNTPTEIRDAIYAYLIPNQIHLFRGEAGIRSSLCIHRDSDGDPDCASRAAVQGLEGALYSHRLRSSWGEHWRCEEHAQEVCGETMMMGLSLTCKLL
jgi:hypothetical protein